MHETFTLVIQLALDKSFGQRVLSTEHFATKFKHAWLLSHAAPMTLAYTNVFLVQRAFHRYAVPENRTLLGYMVSLGIMVL